MGKIPKFRLDSSYKKRGGTAQWMAIKCKCCSKLLCLYQKDGSGNLYRLYADRISDLDGNRLSQEIDIHYTGNLGCPSCRTIFAISMVYKKDIRPRLAFRIVDPGITRTIINGKKDFAAVSESAISLLSMLT